MQLNSGSKAFQAIQIDKLQYIGNFQSWKSSSMFQVITYERTYNNNLTSLNVRYWIEADERRSVYNNNAFGV